MAEMSNAEYTKYLSQACQIPSDGANIGVDSGIICSLSFFCYFFCLPLITLAAQRETISKVNLNGCVSHQCVNQFSLDVMEEKKAFAQMGSDQAYTHMYVCMLQYSFAIFELFTQQEAVLPHFHFSGLPHSR